MHIREIDFVDVLPMTTTGKIIRCELRQRAADEAGTRPSCSLIKRRQGDHP